MSYVVETEFTHRGLRCVVVMQGYAHRCGYVGVPASHELYGIQYFDSCPTGGIIDGVLKCHGGITYSDGGKGSEYPVKSDLWWFGFDCAHAGDAPDYKNAKELFNNDLETLQLLIQLEKCAWVVENQLGTIKTLGYVCDECRKLADQLAGFTK